MTTYIVTETPVEQAMMKRLVRDHPVLQHRDIKVREMEGGNVESAARTILATRHEPVAVLMDTKSVDRASIRELRGSTEWLVGAAGPREMWEVILGVPEVLVLLFQDEGVLSSLLPTPLSFEQRIVARYEPRRILSELFTQAGRPFPQEFIQQLSRTNLAPLWKLDVLQTLERFLLGGQQPQHPGSPA